uniref:sodium-dependent glucose transporter 1C-like isoform X1 n=1 Tax=Styela clava TaxID=7725 RepID=UPI00193A8200|nr:sodium-dependent glucose transporter 1C-like isoform X1 [Styela clava]
MSMDFIKKKYGGYEQLKNESIDASDSNLVERKNTGWVASLVVIITLARIGHGLFISITGPTLLYLADNVNAEVRQVSSMFTGRSAGILVGSAVFSAVVSKWTKFKPLLSLGIGLGVNGIVMFVTPFLTNLGGLVVATTVGGLMFGYLDAGMQAVYLKLWGEKGSRPYIQSFHFGFSVGAFLAPVIAKPFLEMASQVTDSGTTCPGDDDITQTIAFTTPAVNTTGGSTNENSFNPINWCFIIIGTYTILMAIVMSVMALCDVEGKVASHNVDSTEERPEEPIKDVWLFFVPVVFYYFCCVTSETVYQGYIYSVALCSSLQFTVAQASILNSLFWAGFGIGRGTAIIHSNYFKPSTIIIFDLIGTTIALTVMCIWGEYIPLVTWIVSFFHGLCVATLYSSGVSWTSQVTNMAGKYMFIFAIGNAFGVMLMMPAGGALFDKNPFSVMYLILGLCCGCAIFFIFMNLVARSRHRADVLPELEETKNGGTTNKGYEKEETDNEEKEYSTAF